MASPVRSAITSIVATTPGKAGTTVTVSKELVAMREEIFAPERVTAEHVGTPAGIAASFQRVQGYLTQALQRVQRHTAETTQSARSLPVLGGTYMPGVTFTANTAVQIAHRVPGGLPVSFLVASKRSLTSNVACDIVETAQDPKTGRITLLAVPTTVGLTCDLWIYQRPSAVTG